MILKRTLFRAEVSSHNPAGNNAISFTDLICFPDRKSRHFMFASEIACGWRVCIEDFIDIGKSALEVEECPKADKPSKAV